MKWVTRERPKIDRLACPWLVARFIDEEPEFLYVPEGEVLACARRTGAVPFDIPGVELSHKGELCSFDAFLARYALEHAGLAHLALVVRGADTGRLDLAPECAGLLAISLGLARVHSDDHELLRAALSLYDGLYAWCRGDRTETHGWIYPPT